MNFSGGDLATPESIEDLYEADVTVCPASFFLDGRDFEVLDREVRAEKPERTDHPENALSKLVISLGGSAYALYPSVTVELLIMLYGTISYT
jgi:hypothetical protein